MQKTIDETAYRRNKQKLHNKQFKITPSPLNKGIKDVFIKDDYKQPVSKGIIINEDFKNLSKVDKEKQIRKYRTEMEKAAKSLDFVEAARIRDIIKLLKK
jgi:excinuclease ABC subunit B